MQRKPGQIYVLFMLSLAMHPDTPEMFAIDSFGHVLNPRLAKKVTEIFSQLVIRKEKEVHCLCGATECTDK